MDYELNKDISYHMDMPNYTMNENLLVDIKNSLKVLSVILENNKGEGIEQVDEIVELIDEAIDE